MVSSMVHKIPLLSLLVLIVSLPACRQLDPTLNVMSFNVRYNNPGDGEHAWTNRRDRVASVIRFHKADLIGMQEVLRDQISDLEILLPQYGWVGVESYESFVLSHCAVCLTQLLFFFITRIVSICQQKWQL